MQLADERAHARGGQEGGHPREGEPGEMLVQGQNGGGKREGGMTKIGIAETKAGDEGDLVSYPAGKNKKEKKIERTHHSWNASTSSKMSGRIKLSSDHNSARLFWGRASVSAREGEHEARE